MTPMLKVSQVAERLNLSSSKIYEMVESGTLGHHRLGGAIRFSEEQIGAFLEETKRERGTATLQKARNLRPRLKHY